MTASKNTLIAALALWATGSAMALGTVEMQFSAAQPGQVALSTSGTDDYDTGALQYTTRGGKSFLAYCVELAQDHSEAGDGFQTFTIGSFSGRQASALQGLFSSSYASVTTTTQQAAFQTAIWEITHETKSAVFSVTPGNGDFSFESLTNGSASDNAGFVSLVNGYLNSAVNYKGAELYTINKLSSANFQDLVSATPVPEPTSYALMLAGLAVVGFLSKRRQSR
ncbi:PEP-CTERM sorting domain-containing protein [Paucibacter sp. APW11]|uniref:PEP-CTERM sorting domain-containing protein n=1 Tax=Roseateles aquae TaxID=3077235 RepID=A0ABU3PGE1_9BURK|nr:PEP-CTERM sorting domain-containing protein [Paucibacter sp. APW11]MDT9001407.1 PEP-CTERM sorting domain-containing protein [Paucibacter sp. APW11]